jgi:hypothetical protein
MDRNTFDAIIAESIEKVITEDIMGESHGDIANLISHYLGKRKKKKKNKKKRMLSHGRESFYDYDDYERTNGKTAIGDANSIRTSIDTEKTNIAAVARELFPDHTEEGAQSQLRKILNGDRPMTKKIANKIEKMISAGQIAVK